MDKQQLEQYGQLQEEIKLIQIQREENKQDLSDLMYPVGPKNDGMPRADKAYPDSMAQRIYKIVDKDYELDMKLVGLIEKNQETIQNINDFIAAIDDPCLRNIMSLRYIHRKKWHEIADEMNYDERHVRRLHDKIMNL